MTTRNKISCFVQGSNERKISIKLPSFQGDSFVWLRLRKIKQDFPKFLLQMLGFQTIYIEQTHPGLGIVHFSPIFVFRVLKCFVYFFLFCATENCWRREKYEFRKYFYGVEYSQSVSAFYS